MDATRERGGIEESYFNWNDTPPGISRLYLCKSVCVCVLTLSCLFRLEGGKAGGMRD